MESDCEIGGHDGYLISSSSSSESVSEDCGYYGNDSDSDSYEVERLSQRGGRGRRGEGVVVLIVVEVIVQVMWVLLVLLVLTAEFTPCILRIVDNGHNFKILDFFFSFMFFSMN